jgi:16S rRNA G1207 methylase RsmC
MEKSVLLPEDLSLESTKICLIYLGKEMKLTYEQMRMLAQLGPANDRIIVKNRKGHIIKPDEVNMSSKGMLDQERMWTASKKNRIFQRRYRIRLIHREQIYISEE